MKTTNTATSAVTEGGVSLRAAGLNEYVTIARPDHWFKNIFMLPGMLFAYLVYQTPLEPAFFLKVISGIACTCLIASANYVINEYLDVQFDRFHPVKKFRSGVQTVLNPYYVILQWFLLAASGLLLSLYINLPFMLLEAFLLFMGLMYNVKPFRTKDRVYLDMFHVRYTDANIPAMAVSVVCNYFLTRMFVFEGGRYNDRVTFVLFVIFTLLGLGLNQFFLWFLVEQADVGIKLSKFIAVGLASIFNYFAKKYLVF